MTGLGAVFRAELRDLARHPLVWFGACAAAGAAFVWGTYMAETDNGYTVYAAALRSAAQAASFFLLGVAANAVAVERSRGTVRWALPRPISRFAFVLGKGGALAVTAVVYLTLGIGVSWAVAQPHGFGDVLAEKPAPSIDDEDDEGFDYVEEEVVPPEYQAAAMRGNTLDATLRVLPALLCAAGIGLLVSSLLRSASISVIVALGVAIPLFLLPEILGLTNEIARVLPFRAATESLGELHIYGQRRATLDWPAYGLAGWTGAILAAVGLPFAAAVCFLRQDITD